MGLRPLYDWVIVKPVIEDTTESGIYIPEVNKRVPQLAVVIGVGRECKEVRVGDTIIVPKYLPMIDRLQMPDKEKPCVIKETDIWAVVDND